MFDTLDWQTEPFHVRDTSTPVQRLAVHTNSLPRCLKEAPDVEPAMVLEALLGLRNQCRYRRGRRGTEKFAASQLRHDRLPSTHNNGCRMK